MKQNKKGFTLIELLAVIIILAIIALIAVPVVMNIITKARKSAAADTAYSVLNAAELYYAEALLDTAGGAFTETTFTFATDGTVSITGYQSADGLVLKGTKPTGGTVTVNANGETSMTNLIINGYTCTQTDGKITCGDNQTQPQEPQE